MASTNTTLLHNIGTRIERPTKDTLETYTRQNYMC